MIKFDNPCKETPYLVFKDKYNDALRAKQKNIEALSISSYSPEYNEVNARFVNLKYISDKKFIFFSNYNSPKSQDFYAHNQITGLIYWSSINVQIRIKAHIEKTSREYNKAYFAQRDDRKNALAISSEQSSKIATYAAVQKNYERSLKNNNLRKCPEFWGGYSFTPYYFEFWEGHSSRLNKRVVYKKNGHNWDQLLIQP